jgi:quercetin dioxygenase-like cupin family protein
MILGVVACTPGTSEGQGARVPARPAILNASDGEYRLLGGRRPLLLKIDPITLGSAHLFLGTALLPPGDSVPLHRHLHEEEALFILRGTLQVNLAGRQGSAGPGGTVFIPESTWVGLRNAGSDTVEIVFVFNEPAFAKCLRAFSVPAGVMYRPLTPDSAAAVRQACHQEPAPR